MPNMVFTNQAEIVTVWENKARTSGRIFWKVVADIVQPDGSKVQDNLTAFTRELVARFIDGRDSQVRGESRVWNFTPPLVTTIYYEAGAKGKVLTCQPEGAPEPAVTQAAAPPAEGGQGYADDHRVGSPPGFTGNRTYGGYQKKPYTGGGRPPEDKRPSLVTMSESYAKDIITAIISHSDDLQAMDPKGVLNWAREEFLALSKTILANTIEECKALGFKLEDPK